jgi:prepilin-type N-terminal cleavage/methylation domain-containing protein
LDIASRRRRAGFTLVELLVVITIIVLLIAILVPTMYYTKVAARKAATSNTLAAIDTGLQGYYSAFNAFPPSTPGTFGAGTALTRGSNMLAEGLNGYLDYGDDGAGPSNPQASPPDPTYGFRTRKGGLGAVYGPYVPVTSKLWKVNSPTDQVFIDGYGNEILYYRSTGLNTATQVFGTANNALFVVTDNSTAINADGSTSADPSAAGTTKFFAQIGTGSNALNTGAVAARNSYLLVSAGADGIYFNDDDVVSSR